MAENPKEYFYKRTEIMTDEQLTEEILRSYEGNHQLLLEQARLLKGDNKDTILDEIISRIEKEMSATNEIPTETKEDAVEAPKSNNDDKMVKLAMLSEFQKILDITNKVVNHLNSINDEQYSLIVNTTDINEINNKDFLQKEQKAMDLTDQIFNLNTELSKQSFEFYKRFQYFITLNKEVLELTISNIHYEGNPVDFINSINNLMGLCYKEIGSLEYDYSIADEVKKQEIKSKIDELYNLVECLKSIKIRRISYEKKKNSKFDIDRVFNNNEFLKITNNQNIEKKEIVEPRDNSIEEPTKPLISVKQLRFNDKVQRVNTASSSLMKDLSAVTIKIIDTKLVIEYNNQLMEKLKGLKAKLVLLTETDGRHDETLQTETSLNPGEKTITNIDSLQKAELRIKDEDDNTLASYDIFANKDLSEFTGKSM